MSPIHFERHAGERLGWLRASVLGANDGIVSTASLILGVAAADAGPAAVLTAGVAGLVAGAMSMAAGEYVSVSSQADGEKADLARERAELRDDPAFELAELAGIYEARGLEPALAAQVAQQMTAKDALAAHMRDELNLSEMNRARPVQAAVVSAASFAAGAAMPLLAAVLAPGASLSYAVSASSLASLALLGVLGAKGGRAPPWRATIRVVFWGATAMAITTGVGALFGAVV